MQIVCFISILQQYQVSEMITHIFRNDQYQFVFSFIFHFPLQPSQFSGFNKNQKHDLKYQQILQVPKSCQNRLT